VDEHFDVERTEKGQKPEHPGYEQLEGKEDKEDPVIAKVEGEALSKTHLAAGTFARESRSGTARWAGRSLKLQYKVRSAI
jgi:hypothetical protein